ncbi:hypothetical protein [Bacteroides thetaiotaomicron]|uniref:hypothetical protein n=1 Tax=Bacteroides thetaiotaomicron TaxID=818 RepID=UPI00216512AA|nr:hypothetical protein [Bacteroides thetaiotaomicron]MCS3198432.1 hypothetical protein [Bacteroides thetaiotaomicron]
MEYILYISRFLYRIRWWLLIGTAVITFAVYYFGKRMIGKMYSVEATLYTGVASGYGIEGGNDKVDWATAQNAMDNLISIIKAESTLQRVSMRLYARSLINGDPEKDNEFIRASNYNRIYNHLKNSPNGKEILALIDKNSEDKTVENFFRYLKPTQSNYLYGVFYYNLHHYSFNDLKSIQVSRKGASDLIEVSYMADDPGIAYNTIDILTKEFVNEYRSIRYGETDNVIEYFRSELTRIGRELRVKEDSLTRYNVDKRIINYYDETKEIAAINKEFELREQNVMIEYNSAKAMLNELEKHMNSNAKQVINNLQFLDKLNEAASLTGKISEMETVSSDNTSSGNTLQDYKKRLESTRKELSELSNKYVEHKYTKEGISKDNIIEQWLDRTLQYEKAKSDLEIMRASRKELDEKYRFYAPVGSTIKRQERNITFIEQNYLAVLKSYNDALMRRKNLEMTSAALKVLNAPAYPINPMPTSLKKIVMAACAGTFLFILGFFLLLELLDRTLRDSIRARRLIGFSMLGAFPRDSILEYRGQIKEVQKIATRQLSSSILYFCNRRKEGLPYIINFISTEGNEGKSELIKNLEEYWSSIGLKVRTLSWNTDFQATSRKYSLAKSVTDLYASTGEDMLIVEYPNLREANISSDLLQEANLNLLIARADRGWKETDKLLAERLKQQAGKTPMYFYLTHASRNVVEDYTGMLPPYTLWRKFVYRMSQLALTESLATLFKKKRQSTEVTDDDDD